MKKILNVVILYDNFYEVKKYIEEMFKLNSTENVYFSVVINSYKGDLLSITNELREVSNKVYVYVPESNLGYLNGLNYGFQMALTDINVEFEWIIYSNTDIRFDDCGFFSKLDRAEVEDDVWCIAPSVYNQNSKSYDNPEYVNRITSNQMKRLIFIYSYPTLAKLYFSLSHFKRMFFKNIKQKTQFIYSAKGCFFIIRPEFANYLVNNPYPYLMYSEESYIAELIMLNSKRTKYVSDLEIVHFESTVTSKIRFIIKCRYLLETLKYINERFYEI